MSGPTVIDRWHALVTSGDLAALDDLIADDAVFRSPVVHTPQEGKARTILYLAGAYHVLTPNGFRYVREIVGDRNAALEFVATIDGIHVNGIDLIHWNDEGRIDDFTVMVRPLKAIELLHRLMAAQLTAAG